MENLTEKLKQKNLSDSSIKMYLRNLQKLNDDEPLENLNFLKKTKNILDKIKDKKENTQRSYLISIVSVLGATEKDSSLYKKYHKFMMDINNKLRAKPTEKMTDTQNENWKKWDEVLNDFKKLEQNVLTFKTKTLTKPKYNELLHCVVAGLYIYQEPRRNMDYQLMKKIEKFDDSLSKDQNYVDNDNFYFYVYKTSKIHGLKQIEINPDFKPLLNLYYKYTGFPTEKEDNFLVDFNGKPLDSVNSITRILNKVFNKKIGSSMLRHIYITHKFGDKVDEMKKTADNMGHTVETQKEYIKEEPKTGGDLLKKLMVEFKN